LVVREELPLCCARHRCRASPESPSQRIGLELVAPELEEVPLAVEPLLAPRSRSIMPHALVSARAVMHAPSSFIAAPFQEVEPSPMQVECRSRTRGLRLMTERHPLPPELPPFEPAPGAPEEPTP
jgi:hypothetical protein